MYEEVWFEADQAFFLSETNHILALGGTEVGQDLLLEGDIRAVLVGEVVAGVG